MSQESKTFYVTTPIYYPSDRLHIGHALTTTMADTLARFKRMRGYDVWFLTGSDEHGQKIERKAREAGVQPKEYVDRIVASFQELWSRLGISYDDFIRTTEDRHIRVVQKLFQTIYEKGDIYKSEYEGWYCTPCETFLPRAKLVDGKCPDCGGEVELLKEESYFFRLSKYSDELLRYMEENPEFVLPESRRNEMISFIRSGLEDLCISRTTFKWGIPVPIDEQHVIYVWFDALTNYISALGWGEEDPEKFNKYWPEARHLVGKDIVRFHAIIWPIMLMAAGITPPKTVFGHGWLLVQGGKMSKSKGNVVDPLVLIDKYGADAIRYYLLREMSYGADGYYSEEALVERINADLANDFGNLVNRTLAMIERYCQGTLPEPGPEEPLDKEMKAAATTLLATVERYLDRYDFSGALAAIFGLVDRANKYADATRPWSLAVAEGGRERLGSVLYNLAEVIRIVTVLLSPFMPGLPERVFGKLGIAGLPSCHTLESTETFGLLPPGTRVERGEPLFPRIYWEGEKTPDPGVGEPPGATKDSLSKQPQMAESQVEIGDFLKLDLRVGLVLEAKPIKNSDKLIQIKIDLGQDERTIVAGIGKSYRPEELVGKKVVVVANLKPARLMGVESQGMLLAAEDKDTLSLVTLDKDISPGARVR